MDRANLGASNKTVSVTEINTQLLAIRTAAKVDVAALPKEEFDATVYFADILADLKGQKCRTGFEVVRKALATLGYVVKSVEKNIRTGKQVSTHQIFRLE